MVKRIWAAKKGHFHEMGNDPDNWFDEKDPIIYIRTHNTNLKKRLAAYARQYSTHCKQTDADPETGCLEFVIAKDRLSFCLTAPYSKERRRLQSEVAKRNGIHTKTI